MKSLLAKLSLLGALGFLAACDAPDPRENTVLSTSSISFFGEGVVRRHSDIRLNALTQNAYERFQDVNRAYGAMFVSPDGRRWGWHRDRLNLQSAVEVAKAVCESRLNVDCVLYATIVPRREHNQYALPENARNLVLRGRDRTVVGNYMAIARSQSGIQRTSTNQRTLREAREQAMSRCEAAVERQKPSLNDDMVKAMSARGQFACRIAGSYRAQ